MSAVSAPLNIRSKLSLARLPMMPQVLVRLLDLCHRDAVNFNDIADVISRDAGMSAKVISVASSASNYGRKRPANLDQCLTLLGMSTIKTIVINESILQVFRRFTGDRDFDLRRFWGHSLRSALIARDLAKAIGYANHEEAYLGGLMHDVGQLAMLATDADNYFPIFSAKIGQERICQQEQVTFDLTHAEVGAWLVEKWEFDSLLSDGVLYHHDPVDRVAGAHPLIRIIYLANRLAAAHDLKPGVTENELADRCGAGRVDLPVLLETAERELTELADQLGIELDEASSPATDASDRSVVEDLAARVRDVLMVDRILGDEAPTDGFESSLNGIAQAARLLFDVTPGLCFLPQGDEQNTYVAHPLGVRWAKASQLSFVRGFSNAEVARAIDGVAILPAAAGPHVMNLLDEQLLHRMGGAGLLFAPLRSLSACHGVLVSSFEDFSQVGELQARMQCIERFSMMAGDLLHRTILAERDSVLPSGHGADESRERLHRIVHEIRNPLSIIQNYLSTLEKKYVANDLDMRELGIISDEIARVAKLLQSALKESKEDRVLDVGGIKLNPLIEDMLALCISSGFVDSSVEIKTELLANPPDLWSDADRLKQLLLNLLKNAIEAVSPFGGVIRIATAPWGSGVGATHIEIRIEDSGPGIPEDILDQLYMPVSSTKGGNHLGVGLAIVGRLVHDLHGLINCRTTDQGTCFQLLLPLGKQ